MLHPSSMICSYIVFSWQCEAWRWGVVRLELNPGLLLHQRQYQLPPARRAASAQDLVVEDRPDHFLCNSWMISWLSTGDAIQQKNIIEWYIKMAVASLRLRMSILSGHGRHQVVEITGRDAVLKDSKSGCNAWKPNSSPCSLEVCFGKQGDQPMYILYILELCKILNNVSHTYIHTCIVVLYLHVCKRYSYWAKYSQSSNNHYLLA